MSRCALHRNPVFPWGTAALVALVGFVVYKKFASKPGSDTAIMPPATARPKVPTPSIDYGSGMSYAENDPLYASGIHRGST